MKTLLKPILAIICLFTILNCHEDDEETTAQSQTQEQSGSLIFWTPNLPAHGGFVNVTINGVTKTITTNWTTAPPNCLSTNGVAYFFLNAGTYNFNTVDYFGFTSSGSVTVIASNCNKKYLE